MTAKGDGNGDGNSKENEPARRRRYAQTQKPISVRFAMLERILRRGFRSQKGCGNRREIHRSKDERWRTFLVAALARDDNEERRRRQRQRRN
jgi:hypothetical protein